MGIDPPFIYDRPSRFTLNGPGDKPFNPRAVSEASWAPQPVQTTQLLQPLQIPRPRPAQGPLVDFNKHPDSYLIVPYGNLNVKPMNSRTKDKVKYARRVQLALRVFALVGSLGMLFCVIAIKGVSSSVGWIIRVAPAIATLHTVYGVYHLCRSATGRTAASSASYMLFAAMIDTGLVPFMVFTALMAHIQYTTGQYGWDTLFGTPNAAYSIVMTLFLLSVIEGALFLIALSLGIYLATIFRKIAKLPPDMNPLEPNLTARPHKRTKSDLTASEKNVSKTRLDSPHSPKANDADTPAGVPRRVPFMQTRTESPSTPMLNQNDNARGSSQAVPENGRSDNVSVCSSRPVNMESHHQPSSRSMHSVHSGVSERSLPNISNETTHSEGDQYARSRPGPDFYKRHPRASTLVHNEDLISDQENTAPNFGVPVTHAATTRNINDENVQPVSRSSLLSSHPSRPDPSYMEITNWYQSPRAESRTREDYAGATQSQPSSPQRPDAQRRESLYDFDRDAKTPAPEAANRRSRDPLRMNPPANFAPREQDQGHSENHSRNQTRSRRNTLQEANVNVPVRTPPQQQQQQVMKPSSFVGSGGKTRFYGDLRFQADSSQNKKEHRSDDISDSASDYSHNEVATSDYSSYYADGTDYASEVGYEQQSHVSIPKDLHANNSNDHYLTKNGNGKRDISNSTGYSLQGGYAGLDAEFGQGMGRRREVSGKTAEEGRSYTVGGAGFRRDARNPESTSASEYTDKAGAAGWARFGGM